MAEGKTNNSGGIGFFGILTVAFIVLKLTKVIDWSWLWVLAPAWGSVALILLVIIISTIIEWRRYNNNK